MAAAPLRAITTTMNATLRRYASAAVLHVAGRLDQDTCDGFRRELMKHVEAASLEGGTVVLDLSALEYVSSAGLRCFIVLAKYAKAKQKSLALVALQDEVSEIFEISGLLNLFKVYGTVDDAVAALPG